MKQCFRCYHYGHIGTQCNDSQTCGYCAELHETKHCRQKNIEGFSPRCTVRKGVHTAWSNACPTRKEELQRVEQAKQSRSIYWHVPVKANTTRPRKGNKTDVDTAQEAAQPSGLRSVHSARFTPPKPLSFKPSNKHQRLPPRTGSRRHN